MTEPTRILVVDDEPVVRDAFRHIFADHPEFVVVGEASDGAEAVGRYGQLRPDVVLMDLKMPRMSGVEAMTAIGRQHPDACMVAVTTFVSVDYVVPALRAGAAGYLVKDSSAEELMDGIRQALADEMPLSPRISRALARSIAEGPSATPAHAQLPRRVPAPTAREHEVLDQLALGLSNKDIAERLCISEAAVKAHLRHIGDKLGVRSRTQILVLAYQYGLVTPQRTAP
ncbi:DNA-binding response regulator, NarL/FixJ family, contains REC and HTH domains [Raineyella antarctica]|uniref:DNA-binding response regulator, NarL/FixJ family, contains REC and HTH domains n=1 Tax=Raineyella antarctica TaxID=1577474 RepID=A0A1G6GSS0_9ACTN|nr:response regulator transcription factor [Raineyella antarctica]SDB85070.1 DNA-binding response regulator, NarL/FixJ family, contains REC and HTH domains [Raineyella antarctica]